MPVFKVKSPRLLKKARKFLRKSGSKSSSKESTPKAATPPLSQVSSKFESAVGTLEPGTPSSLIERLSDTDEILQQTSEKLEEIQTVGEKFQQTSIKIKDRVSAMKEAFKQKIKSTTPEKAVKDVRKPSRKMQKLLGRLSAFSDDLKDKRVKHEHNLVTRNIAKIGGFFATMKPNTLIMVLRSLVQGDWPLRLAAVLSLLEITGIAFDILWIEHWIDFIVEFFIYTAMLFTKVSAKFARAQVSLAEKLTDLFHTDVTALPKGVTDVTAAAVGLITLLTGGAIEFNKSRSKDFSAFLKGFGEGGKTVTSAGTAIKTFKDVVRYLLKTCGFKTKEDETVELLCAEIKQKAHDLEDLVADLGQNPKKLIDGSVNGLQESLDAKELEDWFVATSKTIDLRSYQDVYRSLKTHRLILDRQLRSFESSLGSKQVPATAYFWGQAGMGKSTIMKELCIELAKLENRDKMLVYSRSVADQYWSGYVQQDVVMYDDFNVDANVNTDVEEVVHIVNTAPYLLNLAPIEEKNRPFRSRYLFLGSNYDTTTNRSFDFEALDRRRHFLFCVENSSVQHWLQQPDNGNGEPTDTKNYPQAHTMEEFVAGIRFQKFKYIEDTQGNKTHASQIERFGPVYQGRAGITLLARELKELEKKHRQDFVLDLLRYNVMDPQDPEVQNDQDLLQRYQEQQNPLQIPPEQNPQMTSTVEEFRARIHAARARRGITPPPSDEEDAAEEGEEAGAAARPPRPPQPRRRRGGRHHHHPPRRRAHQQTQYFLKPIVYIFYGDSTTGKSVLAREMVGDQYQHYDDCVDDNDFQRLFELIKDQSDGHRPTIITMNNDKYEDFQTWLQEQPSDSNGVNHSYERTKRRTVAFRFTRANTGVMFKRKFNVEEMLELETAQFEQRVEIHLNGKKRIAFDAVREHFDDAINSFVQEKVSRKNLETIANKADVEVDLSHLSVVTDLDFDMVIRSASFSMLRVLNAERPLITFLGRSLRKNRISNASLASAVRHLNNLHLKYPIERTYRLRFKEGDIYMCGDRGRIVAAVGLESKVLEIGNSFFFINPDGEKRLMEQEEIDFHFLMTGQQLKLGEEIEELPPPEIIDVDVRLEILDWVGTIMTSLCTLLTGVSVATNLERIFNPNSLSPFVRAEVAQQHETHRRPRQPVAETRKGRSRMMRALHEDEQDQEAMEEWYEQRTNLRDDGMMYDGFRPTYDDVGDMSKKIVRSRYKCRCASDYDCALCNGALPQYVYAEGKKIENVCPCHKESASSREKPEYVVLESMDVKTSPKVAKMKVESLEQAAGGKVVKMKVESEQTAHYSTLLKKVKAGERIDGAEVFKECCDKERHHFIDKKRWCWAYTNKKNADGGKQDLHHRCNQCKRYALHLDSRDPSTRKCYECAGFQMPDEYFHYGCEHCQEIHAQGMADASYRDISAKVLANSIRFPGFSGMMIKDHLGVAPNHCFEADVMVTSNGDEATVKKRMPHKDLCTFTLPKKARLYSDISKFLMSRGDLLHPKQLCFLNIPCNRGIQSYPIVTTVQGTFQIQGSGPVDVMETRLTTGGVFDTYVTTAGDCGSIVTRVDNASIRKILGIHVGGSQTSGYVSLVLRDDIFDGVAQNLNTDQIVVANQHVFLSPDTLNWCPKLSSTPQQYLCGTCNTYCLDVREGKDGKSCLRCRKHDQPPFFRHNRQSCPKCIQDIKDEAEYKCLPTHQVRPATGQIDNFEVVGQTVSSNGNVLRKTPTGRTKLRDSPLRTDRFGEIYEPAILSVDDPRNIEKIDPYLRNVDKWNISRPKQDREEIKSEFREMADWYAELFKNKNMFTCKLTVEESINRHTAFANSNPIYLHTSSGFPYNSWASVRHKYPMLDFDEEKQRYLIRKDTPEGWLLHLHVEYLMRNARKGQKVGVVFDVNLKDEALPHRKIADVKTRSIVACPLDFTIVHRQLCHTVGACLMETRAFHPIKVGIAPNTIEWHDLFLWLTEHTQYGFDADYKAWDAKVTEEEIAGLGEFYCRIQEHLNPDWTSEDTTAVRTLYSMLSIPLITRLDLIVRSIGGLISGESMTGIDNSLLNLRKMWHCWKAYIDQFKPKQIERKELHNFIHEVKCCFNGDDHIVMPPKTDPRFNFEFVRDHMRDTYNVEYTPADKVSGGSNKHITEMTFLKRHFIVKPEFGGYVAGGLVDEAFSKMTGTTKVRQSKPYRKGVEFDKSTFHQTIETYLLESVLRGRKFFVETQRHISEVCDKYCLERPYPRAYESLFNLVYHSSKFLVNSFI